MVITPVIRWIDVMEPGDAVELVHPKSMVFLSYGGVCYVKKAYIGVLSPIELNIWLPGSTRKVAAELLSEGYGVEMDLFSLVTVIGLVHCERPEDAQQSVNDCVVNWTDYAHYYLDEFVKDVTEREEY